jgi:hypothetical protein
MILPRINPEDVRDEAGVLCYFSVPGRTIWKAVYLVSITHAEGAYTSSV